MDEKKLWGNRVERAIEKNFPKLAKKAKEKEDCGCAKRKERLNNLHKRLLGENEN